MSALLRGTCLRPWRHALPPAAAAITTRRWASDHPLSRRAHPEVNVAIIGGGAVGVSTAYHLAKAGMKDVVLLEKTELTAGSTWHAAGLVTYFQGAVNVKKLQHYSLELYKTLEAETGQEVGYHRPGSMRLLTSPARVDEANYQMSRQRWNAAEARILSAEETFELCPILNMDGIEGSLFTPGDGHIDPYSLTMALASGARKYGAELYQKAQVTAVKQRPDGRWDVTTPHGTLVAGHLVNAAGFWGHEVNQMIGVNIPLVPVHHQFVITRPMQEVMGLKQEIPVLRDLDNSYYMRQERGGLLVGPYESFDSMHLCEDWVRNGVPPNFGKELFQPDLDRIMPHIEGAMERVPIFREAEIQNIVAGPITYSPENVPLLGPMQGFHNLWLAVGFGYGIAHAGGSGRYLSDFIRTGAPPHELIDLDANRYANWWTTEYALNRAREYYSLNNLIGYPKEERWVGRPTCRTNLDLYKLQKARGAEFGFHSGWEQPHWFARSPEEAGYKPSFRRTNWNLALARECDVILNHAGIIDLTPFAKLEISGPDASAFLDYVTANTLPKVGMARVTHMLTEEANVFAELTISRLEDQKFMAVTGSGSELHDLWWLERHAKIGNFQVTISNQTDSIAVLSVAGPKARNILQPISDIDLSAKAFKFMHVKSGHVGEVPVTAIRISYTGELGWELYCAQKDAAKLYTALLAAGEPHGADDVGGFAVNALRLEKGFRMWGAEMKSDSNPFEAGLDFFIKVDKKANFIGKNAARKIKEQGVSQEVVMLEVDAPEVDPEGYESVWSGGELVGHTTSGSWSPTLQSSLAFALLPSALAAAGTSVQVEMLGRLCEARVLEGPPALTEPTRVRLAAAQK